MNDFPLYVGVLKKKWKADSQLRTIYPTWGDIEAGPLQQLREQLRNTHPTVSSDYGLLKLMKEGVAFSRVLSIVMSQFPISFVLFDSSKNLFSAVMDSQLSPAVGEGTFDTACVIP